MALLQALVSLQILVCIGRVTKTTQEEIPRLGLSNE